MPSYTADERRQLAESLGTAGAAACPACGAPAVDVQEVRPPSTVAYVRRRLWVLCPACRRTGAVDIRGGGRP